MTNPHADDARQAHQEILQQTGIVFSIERGGTVTLVKGVKDSHARVIAFAPEADVHVGDILRGAAGMILYVTTLDSRIVEGEVIALQAHYETPAQRERELRQ